MNSDACQHWLFNFHTLISVHDLSNHFNFMLSPNFQCHNTYLCTLLTWMHSFGQSFQGHKIWPESKLSIRVINISVTTAVLSHRNLWLMWASAFFALIIQTHYVIVIWNWALKPVVLDAITGRFFQQLFSFGLFLPIRLLIIIFLFLFLFQCWLGYPCCQDNISIYDIGLPKKSAISKHWILAAFLWLFIFFHRSLL